MGVLEEELADSPADALPELDDRDVIADFLAAREITPLLAEGAQEVSPGDVAAAVNGYRSVYEFLIEERRTP